MHVLCNGKEFKEQRKTLTYPRVEGDPRWAFQPSNQPQRYLGLFLLLLGLSSANNAFQKLHNHKRGSDKKKNSADSTQPKRSIPLLWISDLLCKVILRETAQPGVLHANHMTRCITRQNIQEEATVLRNMQQQISTAWEILSQMLTRNVQTQYFSTSVEVLQEDSMIPSQRNILNQHLKIQSPVMVEGVVQDLTGTLKQNE